MPIPCLGFYDVWQWRSVDDEDGGVGEVTIIDRVSACLRRVLGGWGGLVSGIESIGT